MHMILMNVIVAQTFKRFIYRRRPFVFQPPRAYSLTNERSSSFPSRVVIAAPTMIMALLTSKEIVQMQIGYVILIAFGAYLLATFARVHLGSCYPSDCVLSLPIVRHL